MEESIRITIDIGDNLESTLNQLAVNADVIQALGIIFKDLPQVVAALTLKMEIEKANKKGGE